jgi:SAM-dependent methyltransferase
MPEFTADGCPVEVYTLLPAGPEPGIIHAALPAGASILDLGSGTGRIAHPLADLGHPVLAVDDSAEMLAHVSGPETVCARIEDLRMDRRFDAVLLASHLVNTESGAARQALLATAAHHLADDGKLLVEWHPPTWIDTATDTDGGLGPVTVQLRGVTRNGDLLSATVRYSFGDQTWSQPFTVRRLSEQDIPAALAAAGLVFDGWCTPDRTWFAARRDRGSSGPNGGGAA